MKAIYIAILTLLLGACATTEPNQPPTAGELATEHGYQLGDEAKSIHNYEVDGWIYVSNRALIIPARPGKHYLLTLDRSCSKLRGTEVIGFTTTVNTVLSRFDAVVVHDHPGGIERKCYIDRIYEVTKTKLKS